MTPFDHIAPPSLECDEPCAGNYFVSAYPPFSTWTKENVSAVQELLDLPQRSQNATPLGLYLHIPFCAQRCAYCYYLSHADASKQEIGNYVETILREAALYVEKLALAGRRPAFVYFGGGTPTLLTERQLEHLLSDVQRSFPWTEAREVTLESAPKSVTPAKMRIARHLGVTRLSLGTQVFDDRVLRANGRIHLERDIERAYAAVRDAGFDVVNIDLMVGLLGETEASFMRSLERIIDMRPESVTIYQLEIPRNTPLYRALAGSTLDEPLITWDVKRARLARGFAGLERAGYHVRSAYAAVLDPDRHRFVYQDEQYQGADVLGMGLSSFSYLSGIHFQNTTSMPTYVADVNADRLPLARAYPLNEQERALREFVLQLKLGFVETSGFCAKFGVDALERFAEPLSRLADRAWIELDCDGVRMTREGLLRVDRLIPEFYPAHHRESPYW